MRARRERRQHAGDHIKRRATSWRWAWLSWAIVCGSRFARKPRLQQLVEGLAGRRGAGGRARLKLRMAPANSRPQRLADRAH